MKSTAFLLLLILFSLPGCVVKDLGLNIKDTIQGDYFLETKKYDQGIVKFKDTIKKHPGGSKGHYYLARLLLAKKDPAFAEALSELNLAVKIAPNNPDYLFWQGVAHGALGHKKEERNSYRKALKNDQNHIQSLTYLGHNYLEKGELKEALIFYEKVLKLWPASPAALFNRAMVMKKLGRTPEEKLAWMEYLNIYPSGSMARLAVKHLNSTGEFNYRNYIIGPRTITLEKIQFVPFTAKLSSKTTSSLNLLGSVVKNMKRGELNVIVFQKNNAELAKKRAKSIQSYICKKYPSIGKKRIRLSWFDKPESQKIGKKSHQLDESILFFLKR